MIILFNKKVDFSLRSWTSKLLRNNYLVIKIEFDFNLFFKKLYYPDSGSNLDIF